jgi:hypothetical protein
VASKVFRRYRLSLRLLEAFGRFKSTRVLIQSFEFRNNMILQQVLFFASCFLNSVPISLLVHVLKM